MRPNEALLLILLSLAFTSHGCSFGKRKVHRKDDGDIKCNCATPTRYSFPTDSNRTVDPHCKCDPSSFGLVQKVPYDTLDNSIHVDLTSVCVKCTMCAVVADEISETLLEIHDTMAPDDWLTDAQTVLLLRNICDQSFRHYSLREVNGERFISDPMPGDRLVITTADGLWEKSLRDMCNGYLDEIQEPQLYKKWMEWCEDDDQLPNLEDVLCRNELSNLRDCRGMGNVHKHYAPSKDYSAHIKILAECHSCG